MPATLLSHQALVLPLKMRWPHRFSGLALVIGSMAPDLEFIGRMSDDWLFSHTLAAQLWFTIPVTIVLVWIITTLLVPILLPYVREVRWLRLHDAAALEAPASVSAWGSVAISAWLGGMSHVLLDGITHGNHSGWLVPLLPMLRTPVSYFGRTLPLHDALQFWLTIGFAILTLVLWHRIARDRLLWRWRARAAAPACVMPRAHGLRLVAACILAAVQGAYAGHAFSAGGSAKAVAAAISFGALDFIGGLLLLAALGLRWQRRRDARVSRRPLSPNTGADARAHPTHALARDTRIHRHAA